MAINKKVLIGGCIVGVLVGAWLIYKQFQSPNAKAGQKQNKPRGERPNTDSSGKPIPTPSVDRNFPLKKGSKNAYVGELQMALGGLVVDNDFGNKTLAALKAATGKSQVSSYNELQSIIAAQLAKQQANLNNSIAKGNQLLSTFKKSDLESNPYIYILDDSVWYGSDYSVIRNEYIDNGQIQNRLRGSVASADEYVPVYVTSDGWLMVKQDNNYWAIDPNTISIQSNSNTGNSGGSSNPAIFNPNFGWSFN